MGPLVSARDELEVARYARHRVMLAMGFVGEVSYTRLTVWLVLASIATVGGVLGWRFVS